MGPKNLHCVKSIYYGRVQGVGFRQTVVDLARQLFLSGRVKNLDDGSVEFTAEGSKEKIDSLLRLIENKFSKNITGLNTTIISPRGYVDFKVEY